MRSALRRPAVYAVGIASLATAMVLVGAAPAFADTSAATANALRATLGSGSLIDSGTVTASNDGTKPSPGTVTGNDNPAVTVLGSQTLLEVGALPQHAKALPDGKSTACAGVLGRGGIVEIGRTGECTSKKLPTGGVILNLGQVTGGKLQLKADAILAKCRASARGGITGAFVELVNASLNLQTLGLGVVSVPLPNAPTAGTSPNLGVLGLGNALTLTLNQQSSSGPNSSGTTAVHVKLLNALDLSIGNVTCGPNVKIRRT